MLRDLHNQDGITSAEIDMQLQRKKLLKVDLSVRTSYRHRLTVT